MGSVVGRRAFVVGLGAAVLGACVKTRAALPPLSPVPPAVGPGGTGTPKFVSDADAWLVEVPRLVRDRALRMLPDDLHAAVKTAGLLALSNVCPKDRIRLVSCDSSGWFECPGCASRFDGLGDKVGGPSPRGMTFFRVDISQSKTVSIAPRPPYPGLPAGTALITEPAGGPHCV